VLKFPLTMARGLPVTVSLSLFSLPNPSHCYRPKTDSETVVNGGLRAGKLMSTLGPGRVLSVPAFALHDWLFTLTPLLLPLLLSGLPA